ncbi:hypothetical protein BO79DRAFT_220391 [Aspergillus costaricaensis CBS 115574]|uniref:Uncharacterized protein n=1 Tax=Aspergillus costaricaensis CBS 115574 TaxID=1448317 RepID=A0ACD1I5J1_9EURO|nr:hypothetical protein BO79DRAFT_220391 [Aspergillus costaricaensis CBS 115574]RAK85762.1 hypothetical protein BO79DRAFT_220391 [Aspergillus costaricaensis CBS 115574]
MTVLRISNILDTFGSRTYSMNMTTQEDVAWKIQGNDSTNHPVPAYTLQNNHVIPTENDTPLTLPMILASGVHIAYCLRRWALPVGEPFSIPIPGSIIITVENNNNNAQRMKIISSALRVILQYSVFLITIYLSQGDHGTLDMSIWGKAPRDPTCTTERYTD